jgi:hypothetical protein
MRLRNLDLNLLLVFDAVLRERSVVRAAPRHQPAGGQSRAQPAAPCVEGQAVHPYA